MTTHREDHGDHERHGEHGEHQHDRAFRSEAGVALIELEGEVLSGLTTMAVDVLRPMLACAGVEVRRIVDLGCGPGVATCVLAERFEPAIVMAADSSGPMLARATARAARLGRAAQVETRQVDLDGDLSLLGGCDVVHASMALHHVRDQVATMEQIRAMVGPDGLVCLLERADPLRVELTDEGGRPGLWGRIDEAWRRWFEDAGHELPGAARAQQYPSMLASAGFEVLVDESIELRVELAGDPSALRLAAHHLERAPVVLAGYADPADLAPLPGLARALTGPDAACAGTIHATRKLLVATPG